MGQEAYAMFPMLAEAQARAGALRGQTDLANKSYADQQAAAAAFGSSLPFSTPPGSQGPPPPMPGQSSVATNPFTPNGPVYGGPPVPAVRIPAPSMASVIPGGTPSGPPSVQAGPPSPDQVAMQGLPGQATPSQAPAPAPGEASQAAPGAHKWTPQPGEQFNTPDGSRPRTLDEVAAAIRKANPGIDNATLARAAALYMPWMTEADQIATKQAVMENTRAIHESDAAARAAQAQQTQEAITARTAETQASIDARAAAGRATRKEIAQMNIDARQKVQLLRNDVAYAGQKSQADTAANRLLQAQAVLEETKSNNARIAYFDAIRAKHDADLNLINSMFVNRDLTDQEKADAQASINSERDAAVAAAKQFAAPITPAAPKKVPTTKVSPGNSGALPAPSLFQ